jgi:hypothetical protein
MLGKALYLLGQLSKAKFFHDRCVNGVCEPKTSPIRILGESCVQINVKLIQIIISKGWRNGFRDRF